MGCSCCKVICGGKEETSKTQNHYTSKTQNHDANGHPRQTGDNRTSKQGSSGFAAQNVERKATTVTAVTLPSQPSQAREKIPTTRQAVSAQADVSQIILDIPTEKEEANNVRDEKQETAQVSATCTAITEKSENESPGQLLEWDEMILKRFEVGNFSYILTLSSSLISTRTTTFKTTHPRKYPHHWVIRR
jgi:hypothetical protein